MRTKTGTAAKQEQTQQQQQHRSSGSNIRDLFQFPTKQKDKKNNFLLLFDRWISAVDISRRNTGGGTCTYIYHAPPTPRAQNRQPRLE